MQRKSKKISILIVIVVTFFVLAPKGAKAICCCAATQPANRVVICYEAENCGGCTSWQSEHGYTNLKINPGKNCQETSYCQVGGVTERYMEGEAPPVKTTPLKPPEVQVNIPGFQGFTTEESKIKKCIECTDPNVIDPVDCPLEKCKNWVYEIPWIGEYTLALYKWFIGLIAILAVVMIIFNGVRWLIAGGDSTKIGEAKKGITSAIAGLILVLLLHQIFSIIDPRLTVFKPITIGVIKRIEIENEPTDVLGAVDVCSGATTYNTKDLCETAEAKCPEVGFPCTQSTVTNKWCCLGGCQEVVTKPNITIVKSNDKTGLQNGGLIKRDNAPWCYNGNCGQSSPPDGNVNIQISSSVCQALLSLSALNTPITITSIVGSHSKCAGRCGSSRCDSPSFTNCSARPSPHWKGRGVDLGTSRLTKQQIEAIGNTLISMSEVTQVIYCYPEANGKISCDTSKCAADGCYKTCTPIIIKGHQSGKGLMCGHADHIHFTIR